MRALVVIPTHNERQNLPLLVHALLGTMLHLEVLVVDDGSPNGPGSHPGVTRHQRQPRFRPVGHAGKDMES